MSSKITKKQSEGLFELQAVVGRTGCYAPRPVVTENLDSESLLDIVHAPDTLSSALDRIHRGSMTYEEFQTLHGGEFDFETDEDISDDFDEEEFYEDKERDNLDKRGKYYERDKESRILAAESKNSVQSDSSLHKENKSREVSVESNQTTEVDEK